MLNAGTITGPTDPSTFATNIRYLVDDTMPTDNLLSATSSLAATAAKIGTLPSQDPVDANLCRLLAFQL